LEPDSGGSTIVKKLYGNLRGYVVDERAFKLIGIPSLRSGLQKKLSVRIEISQKFS
jgi:hypothetical protein